ncbi:MAG TPA: VWA domain-containing protein [Vicinamibacterales bacterium]|jgi:Ca-activated chloride channel family protein|nr:VWA domain-containing protein [Vicinamibacterales bacterium]
MNPALNGSLLDTLRFGAPYYLWLLILPAILLVLWIRQAALWRGSKSRFAKRMQSPVRARFQPLGGLGFWLCIILATVAVIVALARPRAVTSVVRTAAIDLVVLQDASASMHVKDVAGNRWQRSMAFLRTLGDSLQWDNDRIALAVFAHIAAPHVRLTKDPNTYFFFLDHLSVKSPFPLEEDTTWDTNIALGIEWGLRVIEKDRQLHGVSRNIPAFLLLSDGQAWTGETAKALMLAHQANVPVFVVGVGTESGGPIPDPLRLKEGKDSARAKEPEIVSRLDRPSLQRIALSSQTHYYELDRSSDIDIATAVIDAARRRAPAATHESLQELYWPCLLGAGIFLICGLLTLAERAELWIHAAAAAAGLALVLQYFR